MIRFILAGTAFSLFLSSQAFAGFEWVAPSVQSAEQPAQVMMPAETNTNSAVNIGNGIPVPSVLSEPLASVPNAAPVSILPPAQVVQPMPVRQSKNLSGKRLIINPYPLRNNAIMPVRETSMVEVYKAINEASGKLHPVRLGAGMTTGAKNKPKPAATATRLSSASYNNFLTPTKTGMTPMMGAEPAPLPGMSIPRAPSAQQIPSANYVEAVGFGRDLPLALALSQVVPNGFTHSFAKNIDAGVTVSWEGGQPWNQVLNDMLRPRKLMAVIQGNQVIIQKTAKL